ncbi:hypothetical protein ACFE3Z_01870 [Lactiplantibacillus plantarum]
MYFNSLNQLYERYSNQFKKNQSLKDELLSGVKKLSLWIVSISPRYRSSVNLLDFVNSQQVRLDIALRIFNDATKLDMFSTQYKYRDEVTGTIIASSKNKNKIIDAGHNGELFDDLTGEKVVFVPDLIEKYFKLIEAPNGEYVEHVSKLQIDSVNSEALTPKLIKDNVQDSDVYDEEDEEF